MNINTSYSNFDPFNPTTLLIVATANAEIEYSKTLQKCIDRISSLINDLRDRYGEVV